MADYWDSFDCEVQSDELSERFEDWVEWAYWQWCNGIDPSEEIKF